MKDDVNDEVPNGSPEILIPSRGVLNWGGVSKSSDMPEGEHVTFLRLDKKTLHGVQSRNVHM